MLHDLSEKKEFDPYVCAGLLVLPLFLFSICMIYSFTSSFGGEGWLGWWCISMLALTGSSNIYKAIRCCRRRYKLPSLEVAGWFILLAVNGAGIFGYYFYHVLITLTGVSNV